MQTINDISTQACTEYREDKKKQRSSDSAIDKFEKRWLNSKVKEYLGPDEISLFLEALADIVFYILLRTGMDLELK